MRNINQQHILPLGRWARLHFTSTQLNLGIEYNKLGIFKSTYCKSGKVFSEYGNLKEIANDKYNYVSIGVVTS